MYCVSITSPVVGSAVAVCCAVVCSVSSSASFFFTVVSADIVPAEDCRTSSTLIGVAVGELPSNDTFQPASFVLWFAAATICKIVFALVPVTTGAVAATPRTPAMARNLLQSRAHAKWREGS
jgi:hypothetical protein